MLGSVVFSSYYFAPISYFIYLLEHNGEGYQDIHENYVKQTYRNRCHILSPNGVQKLVIPVIQAKKRKPICDVRISPDYDWQKVHWRSLEAAYRNSPYFEFYEDELRTFFYNKKYDYLIDLNWAIEDKLATLIPFDRSIKQSDSYLATKESITDYRQIITPKNKHSTFKFDRYIQVFSDRSEFIENLSIVDLLFNLGPETLNYIRTIKQNA